MMAFLLIFGFEWRDFVVSLHPEYAKNMILWFQKKSRQDTSGAGSGVEIIKNEPYPDGPGGKGGQYTYKIFHIGNHLPGEFSGSLDFFV